MKAQVYVTLKPGIHDPQGQAIQQSLHTLGFDSIQDVRVGKYFDVDIAEVDPSAARAQLETMCEKLLANPVIENYRIEFKAS